MSSIRSTSLLLITLLSSPGVGWAAEPVQVATSRLEKAITLPRRAPAGTDRPRLGPQRRGRDPLTGVRNRRFLDDVRRRRPGGDQRCPDR